MMLRLGLDGEMALFVDEHRRSRSAGYEAVSEPRDIYGEIEARKNHLGRTILVNQRVCD